MTCSDTYECHRILRFPRWNLPDDTSLFPERRSKFHWWLCPSRFLTLSTSKFPFSRVWQQPLRVQPSNILVTTSSWQIRPRRLCSQSRSIWRRFRARRSQGWCRYEARPRCIERQDLWQKFLKPWADTGGIPKNGNTVDFRIPEFWTFTISDAFKSGLRMVIEQPIVTGCPLPEIRCLRSLDRSLIA